MASTELVAQQIELAHTMYELIVKEVCRYTLLCLKPGASEPRKLLVSKQPQFNTEWNEYTEGIES